MAPSLNAIIMTALAGGIVISGYTGYKIAKPNPLPLGAADVPKEQGRLPTPIACAQEFHDLDLRAGAVQAELTGVRADLADLRKLAEERFPAPIPRRSPSKTKAALVP